MIQKFRYILFTFFLIQGCNNDSQSTMSPLRLDYEPGENCIALTGNGELLTLYQFADTLCKPFFFPVNTLEGVTVTRGYPLDPRPHEPVDHPHQTGVWFTFGDVNGIDFWNNSYAIPRDKKAGYGRIVMDSLKINSPEGNGCGFTSFNTWEDNDGHPLLREKAIYIFSANGNYWSMLRRTVLIAQTRIHFGDNKEGLFAIRLAREFQSDFGKPVIILDSELHPSGEKLVYDKGEKWIFHFLQW